MNVINTHEFWPQQFVLEKGASDDSLNPSKQRWGVVLSIDAKEHTVKVHWRTVPTSETDNLAGDTMIETLPQKLKWPHKKNCIIQILTNNLSIKCSHGHQKNLLTLISKPEP